MTKAEERLPGDLPELPPRARIELAEFLRASCRQHTTAAETESELVQSLLLKDLLAIKQRQ